MIPEQSLLTGCVAMYVAMYVAMWLSCRLRFNSFSSLHQFEANRLFLRSSAALQNWKNFSHVETIVECLQTSGLPQIFDVLKLI